MQLTPAQIEVIKRKALGETDQEAARALRLTERALKSRKERALFNAGGRNMNHVIYLCAKQGIV